MILGMGSDIVDIRRIEKQIEESGEQFKNRIFTHGEQEKSYSRSNVAASFAKRFAAKEACMKALGLHERGGISWQDIEVFNLPSGAPTLLLSGGALTKLHALIPPGMKAVTHVSLSDDYPYAFAQVIISAEAQ